MRRNLRVLKFASVLVALFTAGIVFGLSYEWYEGIPSEFFTTAASNSAPSDVVMQAANALLPANPAESMASPSPKPGIREASEPPANFDTFGDYMQASEQRRLEIEEEKRTKSARS